MKICGIICEFNPFHNGHEYFLKKARALSGCDALICIMSGSFTQRGEICILDKYVRARHAVSGGADCVLELPAAFSVAPAEIFAKGAVKLLSSVPELDTIAFGCESGNESDFLNAAKLLLNENGNFKETLRKNLDAGESYAKSYAAAFECAGGASKLLKSPNNILGAEYAKAVIGSGKKIKLLPVRREGAGYNDVELRDNLSSASAIRKKPTSEKVKSNVPGYVFNDLCDFSEETERFGYFTRLLLSRTDAENLKDIYGCGDGLENALKSVQNLPYNEIIEKATSKRYSSSRIKRILCANFLGLCRSDCEKFLSSVLYLSPLAVKKKNADKVLSALAKSPYPVLTSGSDMQKLDEVAAACKKKDEFSYLQWQQITNKSLINKMIIV